MSAGELEVGRVEGKSGRFFKENVHQLLEAVQSGATPRPHGQEVVNQEKSHEGGRVPLLLGFSLELWLRVHIVKLQTDREQALSGKKRSDTWRLRRRFDN